MRLLLSNPLVGAKTDVPPPGQLIHSPYDNEARYSTKHNRHGVGYKVHLTETCDEDTPHLITHVETTPATVPDDSVLETIHKGLEQRHLLPAQHLLDGGYVDAPHLVNSQATYAIQLISPVRIVTAQGNGKGLTAGCKVG